MISAALVQEETNDTTKKFARLEKLIEKPNKDEIIAYITEKV